MVYIREAHPTDEWQTPQNVQDRVEFPQTRTAEERKSVAHACAIGLRLEIPILIDDMDNTADRAFNAWPERLYLLSKEGTVIYKGGKGPFDFNPDELDEFLKKNV